MGIKTRSFDRRAPQRSKSYSRQFVVANAASDNNRQAFVWPYARKGIVVDIVATLEVAGSITALTITPKKNNSAAIAATAGIITVAAGVGATIDAKTVADDGLALPASATKFVLTSTVANRTLAKGDRITFDFAQSGTTTTGAQVLIHVMVEGEE